MRAVRPSAQRVSLHGPRPEAARLRARSGHPGLRPSFVSLLADDSMSIEHIARLVGRISTVVAGTVHR